MRDRRHHSQKPSLAPHLLQDPRHSWMIGGEPPCLRGPEWGGGQEQEVSGFRGDLSSFRPFCECFACFYPD